MIVIFGFKSTYILREKHFCPKINMLKRNRCTVKLGNKERFDKEQIGIKELFMDYQPFHTINLLLDKELLPIYKMPKLGIKEQEIVKISKKRGLSVLPDSELSHK